MKGSNSYGLVRLDFYTNEQENSTLLAVGTLATLDKYCRKHLPGFKREGKEFIDDAGNHYQLSWGAPELIARMEAEGKSVPYSF